MIFRMHTPLVLAIKASSRNLFFRATYEKFHSFLLTEYTRVIHMDADGFPLKSLDHLFLLRMAEGTRVAAPQGYWFKKQGVGVGWQRGCLGKMAHKSLEKDFYSMFQTQNNTKRNSSIKILETVENLSYLCENANAQILKKL